LNLRRDKSFKKQQLLNLSLFKNFSVEISPNFKGFSMKIYKVLSFVLTAFLCTLAAQAQTRVAVLPFQNMDGNIKYNVWSDRLADSVNTLLASKDPSHQHFIVVSIDSVRMLLAEMNLDPTHPEYASDMWKAAQKLGATTVVTGNFNIQNGNLLVNAYVYDTESRLANPTHQAKDLFKPEEMILTTVPVIVKRLLPALTQ
jgi:TolB-like protein